MLTPGGALDLVVTSVRLEAEEVVSIALADRAGAELPEWRPGAHLELALPSGLTRQYSLCGSPENRREYRVAILREANGRGGSRELHDTGLVGKSLKVNGPRNHFELVEADNHVFIAGGIGITPILAMVRSLGPSAPWRLHYGGRTRTSMAFTGELLDIGADRVALVPQDECGLLDLPAVLRDVDPSTAIYCCGPGPLLDAVQDACDRLGCGAALHVERFSASPAGERTVATGVDAAIEVELRRCGVAVRVEPDRSILDAIRDVAPDTPFSCTEGYCGSCEVAVLDGVPDHRDEILSDEERAAGRTMFPCVSRALSDRLVLDV